MDINSSQNGNGRLRESLRTVQALDGRWRFLIDPEDRHLEAPPASSAYADDIRVPGSWEEQGFGSPPAGSAIDTWTKKLEYEGAAWYSLEFALEEPAENEENEENAENEENEEKAEKDAGKRGDAKVRRRLVIAGARWTTALWVNGRRVGEEDSLSVEHVYDVTEAIAAGTNRIDIRVDNRMRLPLAESHIHTRHTATAWGGITGGVRLETTPATGIGRAVWTPDAEAGSFRCRASLTGMVEPGAGPLTLELELRDEAGRTVGATSADLAPGAKEVLLECALGAEAERWSDVSPRLYEAVLRLRSGSGSDGGVLDETSERVGLRSFRAEGRRLLLNGRPVLLRGYVDCCIFPLTGYPVWDKEHYARQFRIAKEHGFNHVRLHSWNAPEPFWEAADEAGMLVQTELPHWTVNVYSPRSAVPDPDVHDFLRRELRRIVERLNRHPSFVLLSMGNELADDNGHDALNELVRLARSLDPTRLYTDNTGFGQLPEGDREGDFYVQSLNWHVPLRTEEIAMPATNRDMSAVASLTAKPVLGHEHAQFAMYVRPSEKSKYTGVLRPSWLETIEETLSARGLLGRVDEFVEASGSHLVRSLQEAVERVRRTPGAAGFQLLDIRDFPGQGHATTGILDVFWDAKGIVSPERFRRWNDDSVLLMECGARTAFAGEPIEARFLLSHYGSEACLGGWIRWSLSEGDRVHASGALELKPVPRGEVGRAGDVRIATPADGAHAWTLRAELVTEGRTVANEWRFWSFPRPALLSFRSEGLGNVWTSSPAVKTAIPDAIVERNADFSAKDHPRLRDVRLVVAERLTTNLLQYVVDGGSMWLLATESELYDKVGTKYLPVFWNYLMFSGQAGGTMGLVANRHASLGDFPHDGRSDWQWYHLVNGMPAVCLDSVPHVKPIVEPIDNFNRAKRLAYAFEANVGRGRLYVSSFAFTRPEDLKRPENSYLFGRIARYLASSDFRPEARMTVGDVLGLFQLRGIHTFM